MVDYSVVKMEVNSDVGWDEWMAADWVVVMDLCSEAMMAVHCDDSLVVQTDASLSDTSVGRMEWYWDESQVAPWGQRSVAMTVLHLVLVSVASLKAVDSVHCSAGSWDALQALSRKVATAESWDDVWVDSMVSLMAADLVAMTVG